MTGSSASPAARGTESRYATHAAARLAGAFGSERFFVELQRPYERGDARAMQACAILPSRSASGDRHR